MSLPPGARLGPYEIVALLGAGGMGEVYRAKDSRLGRDVAIKSLPAAFAQDPERLARFEREAKLLASLSHPNVAGIFGLEEAGGARYLVLEFVDGETLEVRIRHGPLPLDEALDMARQVAAGVEAAHESGVVHRDLKPGNIMLTPSGAVKVLDFGLAKAGAARGASASDPNLTTLPTMTAIAGTEMGVILGTAAYMSPEQARGRTLDRRTDIWSFGCVLYEMLTAQRVYDGETLSDMVARILEREPDWSALPAGTPPRLQALLKRCLAKDAMQRMRDIGDARLELEAIAAGERGEVAGVTGAPAPRGALAWALALGAVALVAVSVAATWFTTRRGADEQAYALALVAPPGLAMGAEPTDLQLSPDGRQLLFVAADTLAGPRLWLRPLNALTARAFDGTENAAYPFWSPNGRHAGFFAEGKLKTLDLANGAVHTLADAPLPRGGAWGDGLILYQPSSTGPLWKVSIDGGTPEIAAVLDTAAGSVGLRFPQFLPDRRHFVCAFIGSHGPTMGFGTLGERRVRPMSNDLSLTGPLFAGPDWLIFSRSSVIRAQRMDLRSGRLIGPLFDVAGVRAILTPTAGSPELSASGNGVLVQRAAFSEPQRLVMVDRRGDAIGAIAGPEGNFRNGTAAADGVHMLFERDVIPNAQIWMADLRRGDMQPLTTEGASQPLFSPDSKMVVFIQRRSEVSTPKNAGRGLYLMRVDTPGSARLVVQLPTPFVTVDSWSPDGRGVLMRVQGTETQQDLYFFHLAGPDSGRFEPVAATRSNELIGAISPDGHWLAYVSDESGRLECRVRRFPGTGGPVQIVSHGAWADVSGNRELGHPSWRWDGRELLYVARDGRSLMSVSVTPGDPPAFGEPRLLFRLPITAGEIVATPDHNKFVLSVARDEVAHSSATVIVNWTKLLERR
jgi:eukaryotic-like serine/threonine-protein kinase